MGLSPTPSSPTLLSFGWYIGRRGAWFYFLVFAYKRSTPNKAKIFFALFLVHELSLSMGNHHCPVLFGVRKSEAISKDFKRYAQKKKSKQEKKIRRFDFK